MPTNIQKYIFTNFVTEEHQQLNKRKMESDFVEVAMKKTHLPRKVIKSALTKRILDKV